MGYALIVIGITAIIGGIVIINAGQRQEVDEETTPIEADEPTELSVKEKGDAFEDFVVNLLADHRFTLLDRTQDADSTAGVVAESCKNPDLHVRQQGELGTLDYYIECKYRSQWEDGVAKVTYPKQIDRYRQFQRDHRSKVLIALGVGGTPDAPATLRLVPLDSINGCTIRQIDTQYALSPTPSALHDYITAYFTTVFDNAKH